MAFIPGINGSGGGGAEDDIVVGNPISISYTKHSTASFYRETLPTSFSPPQYQTLPPSYYIQADTEDAYAAYLGLTLLSGRYYMTYYDYSGSTGTGTIKLYPVYVMSIGQ